MRGEGVEIARCKTTPIRYGNTLTIGLPLGAFVVATDRWQATGALPALGLPKYPKIAKPRNWKEFNNR
jgi:hypothetical protein